MRGSAGLLGFALLALPAGAPGVAAQSSLTGVVREDSTNQPIAGVELVIGALDRRTVSDSVGQFRFDGLATGVHFILVRKIGYRPVQLRAILAMDDTLDAVVTLRPAAVELAPLEVTVSAIPPGMEAYEARRRSGAGYFIEPKTLRQSEHRQLADIFRSVRGVTLRFARGNRTILVNNRSRCPMQIYLDGIKIYEPRSGPGATTPPDINQFTVAQLEAIEIYRGPAEAPPEFSGTGGACGTVVLWSRRR
jgi:hypothetical protein